MKLSEQVLQLLESMGIGVGGGGYTSKVRATGGGSRIPTQAEDRARKAAEKEAERKREEAKETVGQFRRRTMQSYPGYF